MATYHLTIYIQDYTFMNLKKNPYHLLQVVLSKCAYNDKIALIQKMIYINILI